MEMLYRLAIRRGLGREQGRDTRVERKEKTRKKIVCCVGRIRMAWLGHLFLGFPAITKSRKKGGSIFRKAYPPLACVQTITKLWLVPEFNFVCAQANPPPPTPTSLHFPTRPSCAQHLATVCLFRLLGTNIKFKDGATQVLSSMFLYFPTSRFVAIIFML